MGVSQSIADGYMGRCEMVWTTAGTNRVCGRCLELKDRVVGHTDESGVTIPPLHPRCRCAIMYREVGMPRVMQPKPKPQIDLLPTVEGNDSSDNNLLRAIPKGVGLCKTFDELKFYWAENYNVKVAASVTELNFEAVRAAMSGVEAVLEEFLPAKAFLKEFNVYPVGLMSTWREHGEIYFNAKYFSDANELIAVIAEGVQSRYYPKNMNVAGIGVHEAGHIIEDWLRKKYSENSKFLLRVIPRKLIRKAYQQAILTAEGKGKSINQLKLEISEHTFKENLSECLSDAVCDYIINNTRATLLSQKIWGVLKGEIIKMHVFGESELDKYTTEDILKHGVFDDMGCLVGIKDDAPADFKVAYEADKKKNKKWEELGID